jgi:DNA topoisomerase IB
MERAWPACAFERSHIEMARGWRRLGSRAPFRYVDEGGAAIADEAALARIRSLAIPPAWREVLTPEEEALLVLCRRSNQAARGAAASARTAEAAR